MFDALAKKILYYRNTFIAHLDNDLMMSVPELDPALKAVAFYHRYIVEHEARPDELAGLPTVDAFARGFAQSSDETVRAYRKLSNLP